MSDLGRLSPPSYRSKRLVDVTLASLGLLVMSPLVAVIAVGVRLTSPGPAIHCASRVGLRAKPFTLYKFRSMRISGSHTGSLVTARGDERVTRFGRILRSTKLDELPQLVNVLRGEMSIVGPRPEDPTYVATYSDAQRKILEFRPGLTSPASIQFRHEEVILAQASDVNTTYASLIDAKIQIDLAYFETSSLRSDVAIILATLRSLVS